MADTSKHTDPATLEYYSFAWSEVRLVVAAVSLIAGAYPIVYRIAIGGLVNGLLQLCWVISGIASAYLLYRWYTGGRKLFGGTDKKDMAAFLVSTISGINLGVTGLIGDNLGMSIIPFYPVYALAGVVYLVAAWHLFARWKAYGQKLF